ncbi:bifunctional 2',3'-cyclic-nucleotide 2'-phosphodiesterase/3'-nucleotidase [Streptococcus parasuis]|uniref:bifunctional 2',3'-cyclic-nucleotide 2'-phosphodiesterase/3'-nucleotidase n=1 Tax=Streptococcus parasuis TaxID=1501662 RepID=UPI001C2B7988|nr:bifunctional 2',3'-cyclic-nucleotide 2'-phosphodiesterase/3'-nucleotidase [Streptococcus parasuis]MDG3181512.1 bifunctional 2',3'-cyclic-nucleotide 2'-phosphodiesterase/3'-nucleotidase [Streptococcus suis]MBV1944402.1 bifunctional 2',3'-cyclic-nucleotide 2'-phosphodiesterase/3'-nucleotidase [Streptococcus parasuis]QXF05589.1 bifunctional 2',3'-cyclic-nucleotide 2'-phosphodiesterase/3'-nucleotidase [Streptococcus parasuis]WDM37599.1 bifunctional 2',3'-cyclic-nucleotide 2'-phosphodiesterase/3'
MNFRFSKCAIALSLALLATSPNFVQAEEVDGTLASTTEIEQASQTSEAAVSSTETATKSSQTSSEEVSLEDQTTPTETAETTTATETVASAETTTETSTPASVVATSDETTSNPTTETRAATTETTTPVEGQSVDVRILATTDLHTNLVNYDYYQDKPAETLGLAKTAVLIEDAKAENPNVILVDNGDTIQGTPLGNYKSLIDPIEDGEQHPMYTALDTLGFDAGTLGNHEFNYGLDYLRKVISTAGMPLLNANVLNPTTKDFIYQPYTIVDKTFTDTTGKAVSLKVGITGIVPPQILNWDKAYLEGKVIVRDAVEAVRDIVPVIRENGADIVLVLSHSGIGDDQYEIGEENVGYQIASLSGVDAVITGHSHAEFPGTAEKPSFYAKYTGVDDTNGKINGTPVTMAGKYGDHLGVIDLNLTYTDGKWTTTSSKAAIRKIDTKSSVADSRIIDLAKEAHTETINYVRQQVGETTAPINSFFALVQDDPSVQIVNNAQIWYAKQQLAGTPEAGLPILSAAAPFKAGTRGDATAYTDIPAGPIAIKNVADLYLYDNVVAILKINGSKLKEWLEMSAGQFNQIDPSSTEPQNLVNTDYRTYNFDVIDGVTYQYDITQPNKYDRNGKVVNETASRVRNLQYNGQAVTDEQEFIVVTNNYRANGTFPGVKDASVNYLLNLENRQAIINYITAEKVINPTADNNWTFTDSIKGLDLRFLTADRAKDLLADQEGLVYLQASTENEGFGEFRFVYTEPKAVTPPTDQTGVKIILPSGQVITLPAEKTTAPAPKHKLTSPAKASTATSTAQAGHKTLPATGEANSMLSLLGFGLIGFVGALRKKKEN